MYATYDPKRKHPSFATEKTSVFDILSKTMLMISSKNEVINLYDICFADRVLTPGTVKIIDRFLKRI